MKRRLLTAVKYILIGALWIAVWFLLSKKVGEELLLPSPSSVFERIFTLAKTKEFYLACIHSLLRIGSGVLMGLIFGIIFAVITSSVKLLGELFSPLFAIIKSTPVASFIMLALLWIPKNSLPGFITFLIVFPVAWANISTGIKSTSKDLLEIARVYRMSTLSRVVNIYIPSLIPYLASTAKSALGLAWKAGIAAEVLSVPESAIGSEIYSSKVFFETTDLFAWTFMTVLLSIIMEFVIGGLLERLKKKYEYPDGGDLLAD